MKILVYGATGMLGNAVIRVLSEMDHWNVFGTIRSKDSKKFFSAQIGKNLIEVGDATNSNELIKVFKKINPEVVINCISLSKQLLKIADPAVMNSIYSLLPHQLAKLCENNGSRFIQMSTDGVFSGKTGDYREEDLPDAHDLYGSSKYIGEVYENNVITIRTSIIGHELQTKDGLVESFLSNKGQFTCYSRSIFSGFPTVVLAQIIRDVIIPKTDLIGLYHIASHPISKCDLLKIIAQVYGKDNKLIINDKVEINRSLNSERFNSITGYSSPAWPELIKLMHSYQ